MGNYPDAISFCESILKKYPSAKLRGTLNELKIESARYYNNWDASVLYQKVYHDHSSRKRRGLQLPIK